MLELFSTDWRDVWQGAETKESVGAIFTKPEIVELILDLAGYRPSPKRLATLPLLEPSCGDGAFLTAAVERLIQSETNALGKVNWREPLLESAIRAADISGESINTARLLVSTVLHKAGCSEARAQKLAEIWIVHTDFLLGEWANRFEFVIGNPPYVRIENVPKRVLLRYRELFGTTTDRADLYVAFFERGLELLSRTGTLAFICANRFTKNHYGENLRRLIGQRYHVRHYINLEHTRPFLSDVSAYPAIIVVDRSTGKPTRAATLDDIEPATLKAVRAESLGRRRPKSPVSQFAEWYPKGQPWLTTCDREHELLSRLDVLPTLEASARGTKVSIGVATGADKVYIVKGKHPDIEESRQIPLLMPADVGNDELRWSGHYLLNPFSDADDGSLVDLYSYPGFAEYIGNHATPLKNRHVAKSRPKTWFRTIDRIWPRLRYREKLVIPDIQPSSVIGYDRGQYYPSHNLYWITSDAWPLLALKALLRSSIVFRQVRAYSVQMRGGNVRYQAQTLRRLRIPALVSIRASLIDQLIASAESGEQSEIDETAREAFAVT